MSARNVYEYKSFSDFLKDLAQSRGKRGGIKSELAEVMGSHPAYLSRVLAGQAQLSLEQAERIASHLQLDEEEKRFLLFLLQEERAATPHLKKFFRDERIRIQRQRMNIKERIPDSKQIKREDQAIYYSSWHHSAIHVLVSIPKFRELDVIADYLELPISSVRESIQFLERVQIIKRAGNRWVAGENHLHLERNSPFIRQHHANWRMKAVHALDKSAATDIRYSGAFSVSEKDVDLLKDKMLNHLKEYLGIVKDSPEEKAYVYCFDFFEI